MHRSFHGVLLLRRALVRRSFASASLDRQRDESTARRQLHVVRVPRRILQPPPPPPPPRPPPPPTTTTMTTTAGESDVGLKLLTAPTVSERGILNAKTDLSGEDVRGAR
jgi:hypothetical protein